MEKENIFSHVEKATVHIVNKNAQGVLIPGKLIATATHCVKVRTDGQMADYDHFIEDIVAGKQKLKVSPLAAEPVNDLAVLGALDSDEFSKEVEDFEDFCKNTKPVQICQSEFELFKPFKIHIFTHKRIWITGTAIQCTKEAQSLVVHTDEKIIGGTSGGPIINDSGELVGIVSNCGLKPVSVGEFEGKFRGLNPRPHLCLPVWVCNRIFGGKVAG